MMKKFHLEHWHIIAFVLNIYDALAVTLSYLASLWLRFDLQFTKIRPEYFNAWKSFAPIYAGFCLFLFWKVLLFPRGMASQNMPSHQQPYGDAQ